MVQLGQIRDWCDGILQGPDTALSPQSKVVIDSRQVGAGDLFVALIGPNHDAHAYLPEVFKAGAAAAVVSGTNATCPANATLIRVADTETALGQIAHGYRSRFDIPFAAITGSCGKTTTKEMLRAILSCGQRPHLTHGNLNNQIGLPLTLLGLRDDHTACVVEMGVNHPGEIDALCAIAAPSVGLITNIGAAHLAGLGSEDGVAAEKGALFRYLTAHQGTAVVNLDDVRVVEQADAAGSAPRITYTTCPGVAADVSLAVTRVTNEGARFTLRCDQTSHAGTLFSAAPHQVQNAAAAAALALALGADAEQIIDGLTGFSAPAMRGREITLKNGARVIDDSYNANPASVLAAVDALMASPGEGRRIAVLGDMLELGDDAVARHREVGRQAAARGIDRLIGVGQLGAEIATGAGLDTHALTVLHPTDAVALLDDLRSGDQVLIKGSRGMAMEHLVTALSGNGRKAVA